MNDCLVLKTSEVVSNPSLVKMGTVEVELAAATPGTKYLDFRLAVMSGLPLVHAYTKDGSNYVNSSGADSGTNDRSIASNGTTTQFYISPNGQKIVIDDKFRLTRILGGTANIIVNLDDFRYASALAEITSRNPQTKGNIVSLGKCISLTNVLLEGTSVNGNVEDFVERLIENGAPVSGSIPTFKVARSQIKYKGSLITSSTSLSWSKSGEVLSITIS